MPVTFKLLLPPAPCLAPTTNVPSPCKHPDFCDGLLGILQRSSCCDVKCSDTLTQNFETDNRCRYMLLKINMKMIKMHLNSSHHLSACQLLINIFLFPLFSSLIQGSSNPFWQNVAKLSPN